VAVRQHNPWFHLQLRGRDLLELIRKPGLGFGAPKLQAFGSDPRVFKILWEEPSKVESF